MILTPTLEDIINNFIANLQATIPDLSTTPIAVIREALINPSSSQLSFLFDASKRISILQDVFSATGTDLDVLANSYGLTRKGGTSSSGTIYIDLTQLSTRNTIVVTSGSIIRPRGGSTQTTFSVVGTFTFSSTDKAAFEATAAGIRSQLDSIGLTSVKLAASVPIQSNAVGSQGNTGAFILTSANIQGVNNVVNISPTSGGTDSEGDASLRSRIVALFTGNSVGTSASLLSAATNPPAITGGFLVRFGDPLMTRDGSAFDSSGNLITPGTGRSVDIYVQGSNLLSNTEKDTFTINNKDSFLSLENSVLVGQPSTGNQFGLLPITSISNITGAQSTASFSQGVPTQDSEGNITIEGNFAFIKDVEASKYSIVENIITKEKKLATLVNPSSPKYTILQTLKSSDVANSPISQDRVLFLKQTVDVSNESVTKGKFNGSDQLRFTNISSLSQIFEDITISDTVQVTTFVDVPGGIAITLDHVPIVSIVSIFNTRLGANIDFELTDSINGVVKLVSRFPPRSGDLLLVQYVWRHIYQQDLNYSLVGDTVDWVEPADKKDRSDAILLPSGNLETENLLALQPNIASFLQFDISGLSDREIVQTTITGTTTDVLSEQLAFKSSSPFTFTTVGTANIGRLFKVSNTTKGFDYNLTGYKLNSNKLDPKAGVNTALLSQQFELNSNANTNLAVPGDRVVLGKPSKSLAWSSQADFENNVENNLSPIFDPTKIDFTVGGLILKTPLLDTSLAVTSLGGVITQDTTLSGVIEIIDDLIIGEGVIVDIEPNTVIKVRPSSQLANQISVAQRVVFDGYLSQQDTVGTIDGYTNMYLIPPAASQFSEFYYLYFKPTTFNGSFFTIINDAGQILSIRFDLDILKKVISGSSISFFVNGRAVDPAFNFELETTIDLLNVTASIKATLLGARSSESGQPKFTAAQIQSKNQYYVLLDRTPITTSIVSNDFDLVVEADNTIHFSRFTYDSGVNALVVEGDILVIDGYGDTTSATDYTLIYSIQQSTRISIVVDGTLRVQGTTPQTSVLFTSSSLAAQVGDWEGIVFTSKSHTNNPRTLFPSNLSNARVLFANVGISVRSSDVNIQSCVVRDCLDTGIIVSSSNQGISQFTQTDFNLTQIGDPFVKFSSTSRAGFLASDDVQIARYPINDNMVTSLGGIPTLGVKLTSTSYIVNFVEGRDFTVFIEGQRAISIDTTVPTDGYSDFSLAPGSDYLVEFDINTGYSLVFLYTANTAKLRNVHDLVVALESTLREGKITINYFSSVSNGVIFDNLIINTNSGIVASSLATSSINRNTIDNTRIGIVVSDSIISIRNNLITGYSVCPISSDGSLIRAQRNDMFSQKVVDQDQTGISDTDVLMRTIGVLTSTLLVRTTAKFRVGSTIKIDNEDMLVQGVTDDSIMVSRGQNGTAFASHQSGSRITILQLNQIFTVTGIKGDTCQLLETDLNGIVAPTSIPIQMRLISPNTFKAAFPINRRADFYYKFRYGFRNSSITTDTLVKVFPKNQMGVGANDIVSVLHEIPLSSAPFTPNNENYSIDPLYTNVESADYSYPALTSPASSQAAIYGSLVEPSALHRYVGFIDVDLSRSLGAGTTRIAVPFFPLIVVAFNEVFVVGTDPLNEGTRLTIGSFSFNITPTEANQGAVGVFILDPAVHPAGVVLSGNYSVQYVRPTDLGTSVPPYYVEGDISYVVDAGDQVTFDNIVFDKDALGGQVQFTFQVADSISNLQTAAVSLPATTSPILIEQVATTNIGRAIQVNIKLKGNDSSFSSDLIYQFPTLEDFVLSYLPAKDSQTYKILSLSLDTVLNQTNILIDRPISVDTFSVVGSDQSLELFVRKKVDNFDPAKEFLVSRTQGVSVGNTFIIAEGDLITPKPDADLSDLIHVDYLSYQDGSETLFFTQDGSQITKNVYSNVSSIKTLLTKDRANILPSTESIQVQEVTQPNSGSSYSASYSFEAPLDGETLTIGYAYNAAIRDSSEQVEAKKSLLTDVLVKQVTTVSVRVAIALIVEPTAPALSVQSQVSSAISNLFTTTLSDIQSERTITESDIIRATGSIAGIQDIQVTTLSRNLITGEIVSPLTFERRESPVLEEGSPRINTSQNGKVVQVGV